jgi:hypothetical protein
MVWCSRNLIGSKNSSTFSAAPAVPRNAPLIRIAARFCSLVSSLDIFSISPRGIDLACGQNHADTPHRTCGMITPWYTVRMAVSDEPHVDPEMPRRAPRLPAPFASIFFRCFVKFRCLSSQTPRYLAVLDGSRIIGGSPGTLTGMPSCPDGSSGICQISVRSDCVCVLVCVPVCVLGWTMFLVVRGFVKCSSSNLSGANLAACFLAPLSAF